MLGILICVKDVLRRFDGETAQLESRQTPWAFGCIQDLNLLFEVALRLANKEQMPRRLAGDEFEPVRLKAIEELN